MTPRALLTVLLLASFIPGCVQVTQTRKEQRVIELPAGNPDATLAAAKRVFRKPV